MNEEKEQISSSPWPIRGRQKADLLSRGERIATATPFDCTDEEMAKFWSKVDIAPSDDECWLWNSTASREGYGYFRLNPHCGHAHRAAYILFHGVIPKKNMHVCHGCHNPACCNPHHLMIGTRRDNIDDMMHSKRPRKTYKSSRLSLPWIEFKRQLDAITAATPPVVRQKTVLIPILVDASSFCV